MSPLSSMRYAVEPFQSNHHVTKKPHFSRHSPAFWTGKVPQTHRSGALFDCEINSSLGGGAEYALALAEGQWEVYTFFGKLAHCIWERK